MERCVDENVRWPASLAAVKRLETRDGRLSERPNCMVGLVDRRRRIEEEERREVAGEGMKAEGVTHRQEVYQQHYAGVRTSKNCTIN